MSVIRVTELTAEETKALKPQTDAYNAARPEASPISKTTYAETIFSGIIEKWVKQAYESDAISIREAYKAATPEVKAQVDTLLGRS